MHGFVTSLSKQKEVSVFLNKVSTSSLKVTGRDEPSDHFHITVLTSPGHPWTEQLDMFRGV